ncbi:MAG: hypothetical protein ACXACI_15740 [Candidatus Hodarchaeales archaeon]
MENYNGDRDRCVAIPPLTVCRAPRKGHTTSVRIASRYFASGGGSTVCVHPRSDPHARFAGVRAAHGLPASVPRCPRYHPRRPLHHGPELNARMVFRNRAVSVMSSRH